MHTKQGNQNYEEQKQKGEQKTNDKMTDKNIAYNININALNILII